MAWRNPAPQTLFGRALWLLLTPIIIVQAVSAYVFYDRHWDTVTRRLALAIGGEIALLATTQESFSADDQAAMLAMADRDLELKVTFEEGAKLGERPNLPRRLGGLEGTLYRVLAERLTEPFLVRETPEGTIEVDLQMPNGVLRAITPDKRVASTTTWQTTLWGISLSVLLVVVAVVFMRNQMRPMQRLAEAADSFGKGRAIADFRPGGATEVRRAAAAFLAMRDSILRQIAQRTEMLAGVSHDLRSPLTRMKLELALMGDGEAVVALREDVAELQRRIDAYLAFARTEDGELAVDTDIAALLEQLVGGVRRGGRAVRLRCEPGLRLTLRPDALRRAVGNLLDNALRHGRQVAVTALRSGGRIDIVIDDDGPGLSAENRAALMTLERPAGAELRGLGIAVARDVARSHGGELLLESSPLGGLRVTVRLPV